VFVKSVEKGNRSSLWTMSVDGRLARRLTRGSIDLEPSWAPNGRTIAFLRIDPKTYQGAIWEIRPDGSGLHRLSRLKNVAEPIWSPDGGRLLVHDGSTIYTVRTDGTNRRALAHLSKDARGAVEDPLPAWSPDGRWIAFSQFRHGAIERSDIWIVRADGKALRRITRSPGMDTDPSWAS
jgi:TolB protein